MVEVEYNKVQYGKKVKYNKKAKATGEEVRKQAMKRRR